MLYRTEDEWKLMPLVAKYHQHGESHEQHVASESELRAHEEMGHITELTFEEAIYDSETISRLEEVKNYPESEMQTVSEYVLNNNVLEGTGLVTQKQNEMLEASVLELTMMMGGF